MRKYHRLKTFINFLAKRKVSTYFPGYDEHLVKKNRLEELNFLENEIQNNLHKLKCVEQKKIKNDSITYKKILRNLWEEKHNFDAQELVHFLYIIIYNDLYYTDICLNLFSYFYQNYIFSKNYFNNINVNSIIQVIYSFYLIESYTFLTASKRIGDLTENVTNAANPIQTRNEKTNETEDHPLRPSYPLNKGRNGTSGKALFDKPLNDSTTNENVSNKEKMDFLTHEYMKQKEQNKNTSSQNVEKYRQYYNNNLYGSFHIYNKFAPFIHFNINHINKSHLIKLLLPLSYFINNSTVITYLETTKERTQKFATRKECHKNIAEDYDEQLKHIEKNIFILLETFVEKIEIKKGINKSYSPETVNEKEIKKKNERYENLIDNSYKNHIYIGNEINDHKLICLFFLIISNIFYPTASNALPSKKDFHGSPQDVLTPLCSKKSTSITNANEKGEHKREQQKGTEQQMVEILHTNEENAFPIFRMFSNHYSKLDILNMFYQHMDNKHSNSITNFTIYRNNLLKNIKKYVFLESIYTLDIHYKIMFFKAIYTLNYFNFPFLKHIYTIQSYKKKKDIDPYDYYDNAHFCNFQFFDSENQSLGNSGSDNDGNSDKLETMKNKKTTNEDDEDDEDEEDDENENDKSKEIKKIQNYEKKVQIIIKELSKSCNIFDVVYVNLLNEIEKSIQNSTHEQIINALLYIHLYRIMDTHFTISLLSKLCNLTDKLNTEHKKKLNVIIKSFIIYLSVHIQHVSINSCGKDALSEINVFNHVYYTNSIYVKHLKRLYSFLLVLHNKNIFSRKKKDLVSWANYKRT